MKIDFSQSKLHLFSTLVYVLLIIMYFSLEPVETENSCPFYMSCVRVCCQNEDSCDEMVIREAFNFNVTSDYDENQTVPWEYHIAHGKPSCPIYASFEDHINKNWEFDHRGSVDIKEEGKPTVTFDHDEYCFEDINIAEHTWKLLTCKQHLIAPELIKYFSELIFFHESANFYENFIFSIGFVAASYRRDNLRPRVL
jgi:hypothetical protein